MPTITTRGAASALAYGWSRVMAAATATDTYFKYVTMLLPGNGTNGAQNNTFLDSSTNNFTITRNGNTTQGTFSPYGSNWSNYFDGTTDYLTVGSSANFGMGTGTFSFECWVFPTANPANGPGTVFDARSGALAEGWVVRVFADRTIGLYDGPNNTYVYSTGTVTLNQWNHIAVVRSSTSSGGVAFYINGAASGTATVASNLGTSWSPWIGGNRTAGYDFNGYISNLRVVKGATVYTGAFTPSTTPLTTFGSGTNALLTCQSNRFVDNSGNSLSLTVSGTPSVQRFSPFSPSAAYSTATIGGSGYFDGATDGLTAANNVALQLGSTYTAEAWVYPFAYGGNLRVWSDGSNDPSNVDLYVTSGGTVGLAGGSATVSGYTLPLNSWTHIAVVVNAGTVSVYINGTSRTLAGTTTGYNSTSTTTRYFGSFSAAGYDWNGYISNIRFVKGTAVYTSTFTPPTSPLTAISGTSILLNMQNAAVIDNAMMNDLETVGNAQISTTQSKFGGSSMYFDGTGDYLSSVNSSVLQFGTSDFTIECWVYVSAFATGTAAVASKRTGSAIDGTWTISFAANTGNVQYQILNATGGVITVSIGTVTLNTWNHIAVSKQSGTTRTYLNGVAGGTTSNATAINGSTYPLVIGVGDSSGATNYLNGYIDDFRITNGYARYTANFTPPTAAFPTS